MKTLVVSALTLIALLLPTSAVQFDAEAFGQSMNGWRKNRTASYSIDNHAYRTHRPTVSPTPGGGIFLSTRVEHAPRIGKLTTSYIELTFSPAGILLTGQLRVVVKGQQITTGLISRPAEAVRAEGEAPVADPTPWNTPTTQLVNDLFKALDSELGKLAKSDLAGRRDLLSRLFTRGYGIADLAGALRHNLNLVLRCTR
ncbi:hypothetical protein N9230_05415 [Akkermansiaceae bacterium]|nr:hypothetical protein [Akkermansiaceae bacterium]